MKIKNISSKNILVFASIFLMAFLISKNANAFVHDYSYEGEAFFTVTASAPENLPVFRFWSDQKQGHFYTISESEKNYIIANYPENVWRYEGIAYYAFPSQVANSSPVYRFWSDAKQGHFFTMSETEKNSIIANDHSWSYEGIAYYAYNSQAIGSSPVYRFWSVCRQRHFFTISADEKNSLTSSYAYCDPNPSLLGPEITVGLWSFSTSDLESEAFRIDANKNYIIKNDDGTKIGTIDKDETTKVKYDGDGKLRVYETISDTLSDEIVYFEAADGNNSDMIFDVHLPDYSYDQYRGKIRLDYSKYTDPNTGDEVKKIWVVNALPLEHYVWGDGELAGTGDADHNRVMVTSFRTYGYWWIEYATKWARAGFKVNATPGNQIYRGYDYEKTHTNVKQAAEDTRGKIVTYDGETAITPYSSWTDGETRSFEERWGSDDYPWCDSVDDPYGDYNGDYWDNSYKSTATLESEGNHMVGLSAHGSVTLANDKGWSWTRILSYYFDDIEIKSAY